MNKVGIIYMAVSPSGKVYIGQTTKSLSHRKKYHHYSAFDKNRTEYNTKFSKAIRKYGNDLKWNILHNNISITQLDDMEQRCVNNHNSFVEGYNSTLGGGGRKGYSTSAETRKKLSDAHKGKKFSVEHRRKMSEAKKGKNNPSYGKYPSEKIRKKISKANSGENNSQAKLNLKIVQEIREKYGTGRYSQKELAKEYNVGKSTISRVVRNLLWNK